MNQISEPSWRISTFWLSLSMLVVATGCNRQAAQTDQLPAKNRPQTVPAEEGASPGASTTADFAPAVPVNQPGHGQLQPADGDLRAEDPTKGWPTPDLAILITGRQHGFIEPCGCTGLAFQKGGLARRQELIRQLREQRRWPLLLVDAGNQVRRFGRQPEIKFQLTIDRLKKVGYQAIALGPDDLRLPAGELVASIVDEDPGQSRFVSANVTVIDPELMPTFRVVSVGDYRIGITSVLGDKAQQGIISDDLILRPAAESLARVVPQLKQANCDYYLLLVQASMAETRALAKQFPLFSFIITSAGVGYPPKRPEPVEGVEGTIIEVGPKGMFGGVLGLYDDDDIPWRYGLFELDASFPDSAPVLEQLKLYQQELERAGLEGLGIRPVAHPRGASFVGSRACMKCHQQEFKIWADSPHAKATDSLIEPSERVDIPRHHDPECLSCHVTGWHPQKYYPYKSGFLSLDSTPLLVGNGCENCHGPGSSHVAAELKMENIDQQQRMEWRLSMRLTLEKAKQEQCYQCHDLDNSPDFHPDGFDRYWEQIAH